MSACAKHGIEGMRHPVDYSGFFEVLFWAAVFFGFWGFAFWFFSTGGFGVLKERVRGWLGVSTLENKVDTLTDHLEIDVELKPEHWIVRKRGE